MYECVNPFNYLVKGQSKTILPPLLLPLAAGGKFPPWLWPSWSKFQHGENQTPARQGHSPTSITTQHEAVAEVTQIYDGTTVAVLKHCCWWKRKWISAPARVQSKISDDELFGEWQRLHYLFIWPLYNIVNCDVLKWIQTRGLVMRTYWISVRGRLNPPGSPHTSHPASPLLSWYSGITQRTSPGPLKVIDQGCVTM